MLGVHRIAKATVFMKNCRLRYIRQSLWSLAPYAIATKVSTQEHALTKIASVKIAMTTVARPKLTR